MNHLIPLLVQILHNPLLLTILKSDVNMHFGQFNKIFTCPLFGNLVYYTSGGDH